MHVGETAIDAIVPVGQACMVDTELMQDRGVEVVAVDGLLDGLV